MARTKEERLNAIHQEALREFDAIQTAQKDEREQCLQDRRFYSISGAQWEGAIGEQFENKPKFEVNKVHLAVIRIINEYRNNKITVDFKAKGDKGDKFNQHEPLSTLEFTKCFTREPPQGPQDQEDAGGNTR